MTVRIVFVIDVLEVRGGAELHLLEVLQGLDPHRFHCTVVALYGGRLLDEVARLGFDTHVVFARFGESPNKESLLSLERLFREIRPDLVVTILDVSDFLGAHAANAVGARVISARHDEDFAGRREPRRQRRTNARLHGMIAVSEAVRQAVVRKEDYPADRIEVIPNGCDLNRFAPCTSNVRAELGFDDDAVVIGMVANFAKVKGHDVAVPVALELVRERPSVRFLFIGGDEAGQDEGRRYREMAHGAADRIAFAGVRTEIPQWLSALDMYFQPSHSEGFSCSILEAMACARPVVVSKVGGNPELVGDAGILVEDRDEAGFLAALRSLVDGPAERRRLGAACRERAQRFSRERMIRSYCDALERHATTGGAAVSARDTP